MADTTITVPDLGSLTAGQASDLLLLTRGTTGYKMLLSDLAKYMVETYNSSSLAGSARSVKNALDSLNSRWTSATITSLEELNVTLTSLESRGRTSLLLAGTVTSPLVGASAVSTAYATKMDNSTADMILFSLSGNFIGTVRYNFSTSTVVKKYDIKAEIDRNLFNLGTAIPADSDLNNYTTFGNYYASSVTSIVNSPTTVTNTALQLWVIPRANAERCFQVAFVYVPFNVPELYIRSMTGATSWSNWKQF